MKSSSIKLSLLFLILLHCGTVAAMGQNEKKIVHPTTAEKSEVVRQKFNPIFGTQKEENDLLSFIASHMVIELDAAAVKNIDGFVMVSFYLDTLGNIGRLSVTRSLRPWIDYAIVGGIKRLPTYGKPSVRNNGKVYESLHNMVFSFGSYIRAGGHGYGFKGDEVQANTQREIDAQRNAHFAKLNEHQNKWNKFTTKNGVLQYDTKNGLKNQAGTLAPEDQLNPPDFLPPLTPTITITGKE